MKNLNTMKMLLFLLLVIAIVILCIVYLFPKLNASIEKKLKFILVPAILVMGYYLYAIIREPIEKLKEIEHIEGKIKERLQLIKIAEISYKSVKGKYAGDWNELIDFCKNGKFPVIMAIGSEDDTSKNKLFKRDTMWVPVRDSIFPDNYVIDSLRYVPGNEKADFEIYAGEIKRNLTTVFVFEVKDPNPVNPVRRKNKNEKALCLGSRTEVKTTGNWE